MLVSLLLLWYRIKSDSSNRRKTTYFTHLTHSPISDCFSLFLPLSLIDILSLSVLPSLWLTFLWNGQMVFWCLTAVSVMQLSAYAGHAETLRLCSMLYDSQGPKYELIKDLFSILCVTFHAWLRCGFISIMDNHIYPTPHILKGILYTQFFSVCFAQSVCKGFNDVKQKLL